MGAEKIISTTGYSEAARLNISPSTYEEMKEFFAEKAIPKIIQKRKEEVGATKKVARVE